MDYYYAPTSAPFSIVLFVVICDIALKFTLTSLLVSLENGTVFFTFQESRKSDLGSRFIKVIIYYSSLPHTPHAWPPLPAGAGVLYIMVHGADNITTTSEQSPSPYCLIFNNRKKVNFTPFLYW